MKKMDNYDLISAKKTVRSLVDETRKERPYLFPFYGYKEPRTMIDILLKFVGTAHKNRIKATFDTETLAYLHLFEKPILESTLYNALGSPALISIFKDKGERSLLQLRFTTRRCQIGEEIERENLVNKDVYKTLIHDKSAFYVCSFIDMTTSTPMSHIVVKEDTQLTSLEASYASYTESLATLSKRMDQFIEEQNLDQYMGIEFLANRKNQIDQWLYTRYFDHGQLIQFEDQEAYSETTYTMRQLLTSTGDVTHLLDLMISTTLLSNKPKSLKQTKLIITCHQYKCNAPYLVAFCRHYPQLVRNLRDYTETVKKSPDATIDIVMVKDENATLLSMSILDPPDFIKIVEKRDAKKLFLYETKELLDDTRRITNRDKLTLDEQCKDILLPYINNEVVHFFGPECGELDICQEVIDDCLKRTDQLATREKGLDGASRAMKGCIMYLMTKAKEVLEERHASSSSGSLALKKSKISIEAFEKDWSFAMKELMQDNENRKELLHHQRQKIDITMLNIMMGKETIFSVILPCVNSSYDTYVTNNNIVVYNFENKECKRKLRDYHAAMIEISKEEDAETQKTMIAKLLENDGMPETKKRKRVTPPVVVVVDTPFNTKRLKTKHEMKLLNANDDDIDIRPIITITNDRVPTQEPKGSRACKFCDEVKPLSSFYNQSKSYAYLRNVCHTCLTRKKKVDKAQK